MGVIKQYIAGLSAAFGAFCLGASIGWSGPMEQPIVSGDAYKFSVSGDDWGWITSMLTFGAACMCIPVGILIAAFGRKLIMLILVIPYMIGWICIFAARKVFMLYLGRFIVGACGGAFCVTAPMYTTEIAQLEVRGVMGCFFQLLIVHGILYGFIVGGLFSPILVNILCGILPVIFFLIFMWMPESPVYLVLKGKTDLAENSMKWLRGKDADISGEMSAMAAEGKKEKATVKEAFSRKTTLIGLFIAIVLMLLQQLTGINAILFYVTSIFEQAGTGLSPSACTILIGVVQVFATIVAILLIEKAGRKLLLLISAAVMAITTFVMGLYFQILMEKNVGWLPVLAISLFIIGFSLGFGPVPWLIMAELFAEDVKPVCGAVVGTSSWLFAFCVTKLFPTCLDVFGPAASFWIFTAFAVAACAFILFFVPETKGKTLDEIQGLLGG
ncbi:facilitated trehalose transporter Tret1 [Drosophila grimshawi]|uniref:GH22816 n=1 Tax=Drosophila grimshawi TaxID=7222 RepID=B4JW42_DROGR|nr:facilitated trehalose transporter Tret1 [Drosophila grimshawi]EDV98180.1 GH22816 [Drosophila grimshawi]